MRNMLQGKIVNWTGGATGSSGRTLMASHFGGRASSNCRERPDEINSNLYEMKWRQP